MTGPHRSPYEHALHEINELNETMNKIVSDPDGGRRGVTDAMAAGVLTARSNLAIASAILAHADAVKEAALTAPAEASPSERPPAAPTKEAPLPEPPQRSVVQDPHPRRMSEFPPGNVSWPLPDPDDDEGVPRGLLS